MIRSRAQAPNEAQTRAGASKNRRRNQKDTPGTQRWTMLRRVIDRLHSEDEQVTSLGKRGGGVARRATAEEDVGPADVLLAGAVVGLIAFGVVMVYSASAVFAHARYGDPYHFLVRQGSYALLGIVAMVALARIDYHRLRAVTKVFLGIAVVLLLVTVLGFGKTVGGAARWIAVGPINIQPAEIAKIAVIGWLAYSLSNKADRIKSFSIGTLPHVLIAGAVAGLCYKQPDLGSAVMIGMITLVLLFTAGAKLGYLIIMGVAALPLGYLAVATREYRMRRITAFLDPFAHRFDEGYQIAESLMSFGAGGVHGVGIGDSRQKLFFLPEAHTDFISAIIGEELGFVGFVSLIAVFLFILYRGLRVAYQAKDDYGTYLATGVTVFIGLQALTNLAVAISLLPTKGLVLPFVSYGGSALLVNCAAMGVLLNVSRSRAQKVVSDSINTVAPSRRVAVGGLS